MNDKAKNPKTISYFVNGEAEITTEDQLTVRVILESAGFTPATDYTLKSENPPRDYDGDYDHVVDVHQNMRFQAQFNGPTPVS